MLPVDSPKICMETDVLQVVRLLNQQDRDEIEIVLFIQEVKDLSVNRNIESFTYVAREHNGVAH